ncbi:hypothetical protein F4679DRAFT_567072 [Xylaria curta]|nr:hypothetical protein F4679DRAFT_567072 [Xylaria curta]
MLGLSLPQLECINKLVFPIGRSNLFSSKKTRQTNEVSSTPSYELPNMRATILSLLVAAGLASAQEYLVSVIVESATNKTCAPYKNTTIEFDQSSRYYNTNGNLDRVIGLYIGGQNQSLCIPFNADGSFTIKTNDNYYFGFDNYIHVSPPIKVDYILCGLE